MCSKKTRFALLGRGGMIAGQKEGAGLTRRRLKREDPLAIEKEGSQGGPAGRRPLLEPPLSWRWLSRPGPHPVKRSKQRRAKLSRLFRTVSFTDRTLMRPMTVQSSKRLIQESLSRRASEKAPHQRRPSQQQYQRDSRGSGGPSGPRRESPRAPRPQEGSGEQRPPGGGPAFPSIKVISGGWSYAGDSARSRKRYAREPLVVGLARGRAEPISVPISVSEADRRSDVVYPHADPVTTIINHFSMSRVVVDSGSQVDLITLGVLKQMKVSLDRPVRTPLTGFSEVEIIHPEGRIELPVRFGTSPFKDILVEFTVVDLNPLLQCHPRSTQSQCFPFYNSG